jgi:uncharacterized protein (TIGR03435 family)
MKRHATMLLRRILLLLAALAAPLAPAQTPPAPASAAAPDLCSSVPQAAFDVASVKPSDAPGGGFALRSTEDTVSASGTVLRMIQFLFDLRDFQIAGGPDWVSTANWEITAKVDHPAPDWANLRSDARFGIQRLRLRAVLAQRFALRCHFETKNLPVYNLVLAKAGAKFKPTASGAPGKVSINSHYQGNQTHLEAIGFKLDSLVGVISQTLGRTVVDKTGLTGLYDVTLTYSSDSDASSSASDADAPSVPSIFTALEEQLGLKLESAKGSVKVLVIDHIEKPTEN